MQPDFLPGFLSLAGGYTAHKKTCQRMFDEKTRPQNVFPTYRLRGSLRRKPTSDSFELEPNIRYISLHGCPSASGALAGR